MVLRKVILAAMYSSAISRCSFRRSGGFFVLLNLQELTKCGRIIKLCQVLPG